MELASFRVETGLYFSISGSKKAEQVPEKALFGQKNEKALFFDTNFDVHI